jgi:hypothetical protein
VPLGRWSNKTHHKWKWYYNKGKDELYHINGGTVQLYTCEIGWQTWSMTSYKLAYTATAHSKMLIGVPTYVLALLSNRVNKLQEGLDPPVETSRALLIWEYLETWGGTWMWEDIDDSQATKADTSRITEGLKAGSLIWATDGSYDRKQAADLSGMGWIIFCKTTVFLLSGSFWEKSSTASLFCV